MRLDVVIGHDLRNTEGPLRTWYVVQFARIAVEARKILLLHPFACVVASALAVTARGPRSGQMLPPFFVSLFLHLNGAGVCERMMTADFSPLLNRPSLYHVSMLGGRSSDGLVSPLILILILVKMW